jgi:hypothetical protein
MASIAILSEFYAQTSATVALLTFNNSAACGIEIRVARFPWLATWPFFSSTNRAAIHQAIGADGRSSKEKYCNSTDTLCAGWPWQPDYLRTLRKQGIICLNRQSGDRAPHLIFLRS